MMKKTSKIKRSDFEGCQLHCVPAFATGAAPVQNITLMGFLKSKLAYPWNHYVKKWLKKNYYAWVRFKGETVAQKNAKASAPD